MKRILIIKLSALGDIIQAEGAVHDIKNHHPGAEIIAMTSPAYVRFMEKCPWVDSVIVDSRAPRWHLPTMLTLRNTLRAAQIDEIYDLQQVARTEFYRRFLFSKTSTYHCRSQSSSLVKTKPRKKCAAEEFVDHFVQMGISVRHSLHPDISWMAPDMDEFLTRNNLFSPFVVLIPGASTKHIEKRWAHYDALAAWLTQRGRKVITVPGPAEMELCRSLRNATMITHGKRYLDIFELAGVLNKAEYVIGNDTGPTHMAAHLKKPGLALFSKHVHARQTGIQHTQFSFIEVDSLQTLSLSDVIKQVASAIN